PSQLAQAIEKKRGKDTRYTWAEIADLVYLPSLLRACRDWPRRRSAADERNKVAPFHSSGSRASTERYGPAQGLPDTKVGTFTPVLYDEAKKNGWTVISMKNDWKRIFAFE